MTVDHMRGYSVGAVLWLTMLWLVACAAPPNLFLPTTGGARPSTPIEFDRSVIAGDIRYLGDALELLKGWSLEWYSYIGGAGALQLAYEPGILAQGMAAYSRCCDLFGRGRIQVGYRLSEVTGPPANTFTTPGARRLALLSLLVHEVTHIRDLRAGEFAGLSGSRRCMAMERHAFQVQLAFWRALDAMQLSAVGDEQGDFRAAIAGQLASQPRRLSNPHFWQYYCGDR